MTPDQLFVEFERGFEGRRFSAGLLVACIDFLIELDVPALQFQKFDDFLAMFPRCRTTSAGKRANTLIVERQDSSTLSLRPFYNSAERYYRADHKRFDYPSCAPHATQAWGDYLTWLDALVGFSLEQLSTLRERVNKFVLDSLASHEFDPASVNIDPPLFRLLLESFEMKSRTGEPTGAAFQGVVFGFLRADNPHLQIEIDKVRTGSRRLQRIGDVDGWEGARLAISAEVKQFQLNADNLPDLEDFANATGQRGALGVIAALSFGEGVREALEELGLIPLDTGGMLGIVELWDPIKQRIAVSSLIYYATHVEKNSVLAERLAAFLSQSAEEWNAERKVELDEETIEIDKET